jgi:hypothetical protein
MSAADGAHGHTAHLSVVVSGTVRLEHLCDDPELCQSLANQVRAAASALRLTAVREHIRRTAMQFERSQDRTSTALTQFLDQALGNPKVPGERVESIWHAAVQRIATVKDRAGDFATILQITDLISKAGAPTWAERARIEPATDRIAWYAATGARRGTMLPRMPSSHRSMRGIAWPPSRTSARIPTSGAASYSPNWSASGPSMSLIAVYRPR